jgi:hypothetical protein
MAVPVYLTASGVVGISGVMVTVMSIIANGGGTAGTIVLHNGTGAGAPVKASIPVAASGFQSAYLEDGWTFKSGCYAEFTGGIANATFGVK